MLYESIIARVRNCLNNNGIFATHHEVDTANQRIQRTQEASDQLWSEQILTTLEVLETLLDRAEIDPQSPLDKVITSLRKMVVEDKGTDVHEAKTNTQAIKPRIPKSLTLPRKRLCYICRLPLKVPHPTQPAMCRPCGAFNLASSQISTPSNLTLPATFTALVTGARINLGYHTTLRLLRCGARVVATSRYPRDAVVRYTQESDYQTWKDRLRVLGADFRRASDVFDLVKETRRCLREWNGAEKLYLLVNNAAQTLTDSVRKEERGIKRESCLVEMAEQSGICIPSDYKPRVRGGGLLMALGGLDRERGLLENGSNTDCSRVAAAAAKDTGHSRNGGQNVEVHDRSSWVQSLFEIPYEDVISAHSVNTFVPLILCRELLPYMGEVRNPPQEINSQPSTIKPEAYIINVSSREGIFENQTRSIGKAGRHVHTNMSKAALNMITETEAASAWHTRKVAMNTVDPGYMSAAPEYEGSFNGERPIGWEDGAGRILWPVAVGELESEAIWGRFLKHYGAVNVDPGAGRG